MIKRMNIRVSGGDCIVLNLTRYARRNINEGGGSNKSLAVECVRHK